MSEIKVRVGYVAIEDYTEDYSDWTGQITFPNPRGANIYWENPIEFLEAEPVLKLLRELGEVKRLVNSVNELLEIESKKNLSKIKPNPNNKYIPIGGDFKKNAAYYEVDHAINRFSKTLEKLNTFLASIDKEDGK